MEHKSDLDSPALALQRWAATKEPSRGTSPEDFKLVREELEAVLKELKDSKLSLIQTTEELKAAKNKLRTVEEREPKSELVTYLQTMN